MRMFKTLLGILALVATLGVSAADLQEGRQYKLISPPQPTEAKGKIEVTEFFWYGCSHCFDFEPLVSKWKKTLPADVVFRRVPAVFRDSWAPGAKTFYALEATGQLDKLHQEVFDAIHIDRMNPADEKAIADLIAKKGGDKQKFLEAYNSFAVQSKVSRAAQTTQAHGITGVPAIVVNGKYTPAQGAAGSFADVLVIVDQLIAKARAEQAKK
jgi:thiol:disulfide interchange protein DsbA